MKSIYFDTEAREILNKMLKKEPSFNLSAFVKQALLKGSGFNNLDINTIRKNKANAQAERKKVDNEIEFWNEKEKQALVDEEIMRRKNLDEALELEAHKKKQEKIKEQVLDIFKAQTGRDMSEAEYQAYDGLEKGNIYSFIEKIKGEPVEALKAPHASNSQ